MNSLFRQVVLTQHIVLPSRAFRFQKTPHIFSLSLKADVSQASTDSARQDLPRKNRQRLLDASCLTL